MNAPIELVMEKFEKVFIDRKNDIENYLKKYYNDLFNNRVVRNVERIDATHLIKTLGFRKNLSSWKNSYDNLVVSTCTKIKGEKKRFNYKFYFIEEKLSSEIVRQLEDIISDVNNLKEQFEFSEIFKRISNAEDLIKKKKDAYFNNLLINLKFEVKKAEEYYKDELKKITLLEQEVQKNQLKNDFKLAMNIAEEIINCARKFKLREKEKEFTDKNIELKNKAELYLSETITNLEAIAIIKKNEFLFDEAINFYENIIALLEKNEKNDLIDKYLKKKEEIKIEREEHQKNKELNQIRDQIAELEKDIMKNYDVGNHEEVLMQCNAIINLFEKIEELDSKNKYIEFIKEVKDKIAETLKQEEEITLRKKAVEKFLNLYDEQIKEKKKEQENLIRKAEKCNQLIEIQEDLIPIIEDFTVQDLLGDLSSDIQQQLEQLGSILEEHRVDVKSTISNRGIIIRSTGEALEIENEINANQIRSNEREVLYDVQIKLENQFDDVIEEAILTDLIPYNFEVVNIKISIKGIERAEEKILTKDGLEITWNLKKIQPKEKIEIVYDLRHRISRTIIFMLESQLKIIKTHVNIEETTPRMEGFHEASIPFINPGPNQLKGLIIEDIIPLYYIHNIKEPKSFIPRLDQSNKGDLIKWNIGTMGIDSINHHYKLLEIFKFEEIKLLIDEIDQEAFDCLKKKEISSSIEKYNEILAMLDKYFN